MDANRALEAILTALLGGGGIAGLIAAWRAKKSRDAGASGDEGDAIRQVAAEVGTASDLIRFWQTEIRAVRSEYARYKDRTDRDRRWYERRIDQLEQWIWERKAPPPPPEEPRNEGK